MPREKGLLVLDKIFGRDGRHIGFGIIVLTILVALFFVSALAGFSSLQLICYSFMAAAFVESIAVPRLSPIKTSVYDESTPVTSYILGNRTTTLSTSYLLIEIIVAAVMLHFNFGRLTLAFYIQAAMMVAYLSLVAFVTSHPGKSEERHEASDLNSDEVEPAHTSNRHADDSKPVSHERMGQLIKELLTIMPKTTDAETRKQLERLVDALKKCPPDSYESMNDVDMQMSALTAELGERVRNREWDMAKECVMLVLVLSNQRTALYNQILKANRKARKDSKATKKHK